MADEPVVNIRLIVERPPHGVTLAVQLGRTSLQKPVVKGRDLVFDIPLRVRQGPGRRVVFLGPAAQGPPADRFIYVNSGTMAGQSDSCWSRRAKVKLAGIDPAIVERTIATPGARIEGRIVGSGRNGSPVCASASLLEQGWTLARG